MLSVQNIKEKRFEKAMFGGYDLKSVDDYMEEISSEFSVLLKENSALQQKLKELTDKNEEYKSVENSMRKALLSAQSIAAEMVEKAEKDRDAILNNAQEIAQEQIHTYRKQIAEEQINLENIQNKTSKFISKLTAFHESQINEFVEFSKNIPNIKFQKTVSPNIEDFTLTFSQENLEELNSIADKKDELSNTETILNRIKSETIDAKPALEPCFTAVSDNDLSLSISQSIDLNQSGKYDISELKFGKGYDGD